MPGHARPQSTELSELVQNAGRVGDGPEVDHRLQYRGADGDQIGLDLHLGHAGEQAPLLVDRVVDAGLGRQAPDGLGVNYPYFADS